MNQPTKSQLREMKAKALYGVAEFYTKSEGLFEAFEDQLPTLTTFDPITDALEGVSKSSVSKADLIQMEELETIRCAFHQNMALANFIRRVQAVIDSGKGAESIKVTHIAFKQMLEAHNDLTTAVLINYYHRHKHFAEYGRSYIESVITKFYDELIVRAPD